MLPAGSRPLRNPAGGAPGFAIENVWALPGLPAEMEAMFDAHADGLVGGEPIATWRRVFGTREGEIVEALETATARWPQVMVGSYPRFDPGHAEVEVVLKSTDAEAVADAAAWLEQEIERAEACER
jgi:molybdopterin-biosynthesis enzyme MoeA-like protein